MKVPDSLQTFGSLVFVGCTELVPEDNDLYEWMFEDMHGHDEDVTPRIPPLYRIIISRINLISNPFPICLFLS